MKKTFQIEKTKDWLRAEEARIYRMIQSNEDVIESFKSELKFIKKCREEINEANKMLREKWTGE